MRMAVAVERSALIPVTILATAIFDRPKLLHGPRRLDQRQVPLTSRRNNSLDLESKYLRSAVSLRGDGNSDREKREHDRSLWLRDQESLYSQESLGSPFVSKRGNWYMKLVTISAR